MPSQKISDQTAGSGCKTGFDYPPVLGYGFRPFFLLAALHAALLIPTWIVMLHGLEIPLALPAYAWHAHEMLYGFVAAAMTGFLLTAVPSWTSRRGYAGLPLLALVLLWLAGRLVMTWPIGLNPLLAVLIDLAFLPIVALTILPALLRSGNRQNFIFILFLLILFAANLDFHISRSADISSLRLSVNTILMMLALLAGRLVPAFTSSGLKQRGLDIRIPRHRLLDRTVLICMAAILVVDLIAPESKTAAGIACITALMTLIQLWRWQGFRSLGEPLIWILHLAYCWIPIGLSLKAATLFDLSVPANLWLHALVMGTFSTMILAIMSRAALGHTGRKLVAPSGMVAGYYLLTAAVLCRVFGPLLDPQSWNLWLTLAGIFWSLAFVVYVLVYGPILCQRRADGREG